MNGFNLQFFSHYTYLVMIEIALYFSIVTRMIEITKANVNYHISWQRYFTYPEQAEASSGRPRRCIDQLFSGGSPSSVQSETKWLLAWRIGWQWQLQYRSWLL